MLLCNSWKMKCFNGSKTWEITWNDPFAILRFPLSKLVFNSLWNDNNFFRAFLLLYTIFKERLNLKPKKKTTLFQCMIFLLSLSKFHTIPVLYSLYSHTLFTCFWTKKWWNIQLTTTNPYQYFAFDTPLQKHLWEKYNFF